MRTLMIAASSLVLAASLPPAASAQNGHFVGQQDCEGDGLAVTCEGKVAGLGSETFNIVVTADASATVECTNPGGNVAPGQSFDYVAEGATGEMETPRNGSYTYSISTDAPEAPADACPNGAWTAEVVDVEYGPATVSLYEGGALVDSVTLPVD
ncbi:hypothetical protein [Ornithinimicrobium cavernae]|uniref:hypothetical protein n=1 Tax=Ornithinimicrobium cavernae TaxID=2666047 RepID=UPI000D68E020|nr:hypothetical protein [Ornithinimicrobium cavernae]